MTHDTKTNIVCSFFVISIGAFAHAILGAETKKSKEALEAMKKEQMDKLLKLNGK